MLGWWLGSILFFIIWVAIAFWPARVAARKGAQLFRLLPLQPDLFPGGADRGVHGSGQAGPGLTVDLALAG
jgi:hypothetical protein